MIYNEDIIVLIVAKFIQMNLRQTIRGCRFQDMNEENYFHKKENKKLVFLTITRYSVKRPFFWF